MVWFGYCNYYYLLLCQVPRTNPFGTYNRAQLYSKADRFARTPHCKFAAPVAVLDVLYYRVRISSQIELNLHLSICVLVFKFDSRVRYIIHIVPSFLISRASVYPQRPQYRLQISDLFVNPLVAPLLSESSRTG